MTLNELNISLNNNIILENVPLTTYGQLKIILKGILNKKKTAKILKTGGEVTLDQIIGLIPGASNIKSGFDLFKSLIDKPDTKKTNSWLDKLDIDDQTLKMLDDTVENGFIEAMRQSIMAEPDDKLLEQDFDMNNRLVKYLKEKYQGRTITRS